MFLFYFIFLFIFHSWLISGAADDDYQNQYDDDDSKSEPNNIKEDNTNRVSSAILTKKNVHRIAQIGQNVTLVCDAENLGRKYLVILC